MSTPTSILTPRDICRELQIGRRRLSALVRSGQLKPLPRPSRRSRMQFTRAALNEYLDRGRRRRIIHPASVPDLVSDQAV